MRKRWFVFLFCCLIFAAATNAAHIAQKKLSSPEKTAKNTVAPTAAAELDQFLNQIFQDIKEKTEFKSQVLAVAGKGPSIVPLLVAKVHDPAAAWQERWFSAMALGHIGGPAAAAELKKGLNDQLFIIRLAAVKGLVQIGDLSAAAEIRKLISDPAMVVRSEVALTLGQWRDQPAVGSLAEELHNALNFYRGRSLPVREKIIVALGQLANPQAVPTLIKELQRQDSLLYPQTLAALDRIAVNGHFKTPLPKIKHDRAVWLSWWEAEQKTKS